MLMKKYFYPLPADILQAHMLLLFLLLSSLQQISRRDIGSVTQLPSNAARIAFP